MGDINAGTSKPEKTEPTFENDKESKDEEAETYSDEEQLVDEETEIYSDEDGGLDPDFMIFDGNDTSEDESDDMANTEPTEAGATDNIVPTTINNTVTPKWSSICTGMHNFLFSKRNELLVPIPSPKPIDFFRMILDDHFLNIIIEEINRYAEDIFCSKGVSEGSKITQWKPLTNSELLTFIGLVLHTGTIKMERLQDYFKADDWFDVPCFSCFSKYMSRDRFLLIMRCLHFSKKSNAEEVCNDELYKIRPVLDFFNQKMSTIYYPNRELSISVPMVIWHGRLVFHEYVQKMYEYGVKFYMLTEPSGIILKCYADTGALNNGDVKRHSAKVVLNLLEEKLHVGHSVYLDDFYNSYDLANELIQKETYCTGIVQGKRKGNPPNIVSAKLKKGETVARYSNGIMVGKWRGKHYALLYITTEFENNIHTYADKRGRNKEEPTVITALDKYFGDVDHQERIQAQYPCDIITLKWYKKIFIHIIQLMLLNSYFLYKKYSTKKMSLYEFRLKVIQDLLNLQEKKDSPAPKVPKLSTDCD